MTPPCVPKFSPSPCPTHYDERLATTTSADFCSITQSVSAPVRCLKIGRVLWLPCRFQQDLIQTPMDSRLLFEQISPDKNVNCLCTTAPFTVSLEPEGFVVVCQLAPKISAFYDGSVRRLTDLPPASSGHSLASLPLLLASGCRHSAPITFEHLDAGSTTGDFHPMSSRPCWAYTVHLRANRVVVYNGNSTPLDGRCIDNERIEVRFRSNLTLISRRTRNAPDVAWSNGTVWRREGNTVAFPLSGF